MDDTSAVFHDMMLVFSVACVVEATRVEYANSFMDKLRTFFEL